MIFIDDIEEVAEQVIAEATAFTGHQIRNRISTKRTETRRAVTSRANGNIGEVGIKFPPNKRYRTRGTETEQIAKQAWRETQPATLELIKKRLQENIEE